MQGVTFSNNLTLQAYGEAIVSLLAPLSGGDSRKTSREGF